LREMVRAKASDPRWTQKGGIYTAETFTVPGTSETYRVIALDVRFSKDPWSVPKLQGDMLGEEQWTWLERQLCGDPTPRVNLIVSGLQVLMEGRGAGEAWANFPKSRERLFRLMKRCQVKAPLFLSGDVHMAEMFEARCGGKDVVAEVTSSGMTHSWGTRSPGWTGEILALNLFLHALMEFCQQVMPWNYRSIRAEGADKRTGAYFLGLNFAEIDLDFTEQRITVEVVNKDNRAVLKQSWAFKELDLDVNPVEDLDLYSCEPLRGRESLAHLVAARALLISVMFVIPIALAVYVPFKIVSRLLA